MANSILRSANRPIYKPVHDPHHDYERGDGRDERADPYQRLEQADSAEVAHGLSPCFFATLRSVAPADGIAQITEHGCVAVESHDPTGTHVVLECPAGLREPVAFRMTPSPLQMEPAEISELVERFDTECHAAAAQADIPGIVSRFLSCVGRRQHRGAK